jgi:hypothetical protein
MPQTQPMPPLTTEAILQEFGQAASGDAEAILRMADEIARLRARLKLWDPGEADHGTGSWTHSDPQ